MLAMQMVSKEKERNDVQLHTLQVGSKEKERNDVQLVNKAKELISKC